MNTQAPKKTKNKQAINPSIKAIVHAALSPAHIAPTPSAPQEVNATIAQASGGRLTLGEMDTEGVERWVDQKKAQVGGRTRRLKAGV